VSINFNELRELLSAIAQTDISELTLKSDEFELTVRKGVTMTQPVISYGTPEMRPVPMQPSPELTPAVSDTPPSTETTPLTPIEKNWVEITSPMVGTFYSAPAPGEAPFAEVGDRLSVGQTVCIIEAMKLMNEIETEVAGEIMEIAVKNGEPVEYGQTLMWIKPN
jgi:acetyl-CoA carboxylase biotin carboxyl carrier protein